MARSHQMNNVTLYHYQDAKSARRAPEIRENNGSLRGKTGDFQKGEHRQKNSRKRAKRKKWWGAGGKGRTPKGLVDNMGRSPSHLTL